MPRFCVFLRFFLFFLPFMMGAGAAEASLLFCNKANVAIEAALGVRSDGVWSSDGWWQIEPHSCARVISNPLKERFYFYYARALEGGKSKKTPKVWDGKYNFCVDSTIFHIEGDSHCARRGYVKRGFREVDVGAHQKKYTVTFQ